MIESFSKIFKRGRSSSTSKSQIPSSSASAPSVGYKKVGHDVDDHDLKLPEIERTEFYFSYGSNMLPHLKKCKDIQPYSIRRDYSWLAIIIFMLYYYK